MKQGLTEWAVICRALAEGKQALLVRTGADFRVEHTMFWLVPTYPAAPQAGLRAEAWPWLAEIEARRPPAGIMHISHCARIDGIYRVHDLTAALCLLHLHYWSEDFIRQSFAPGGQGLLVMPVRVYQAPQVFTVPDTCQGNQAWVELEDLPTEGAVPVLSDQEITEVHRSLDLLLNPTALA